MIPTDLSPIDQAVARALEENGFYYDGKTQVVVDCNLIEGQEEFLGWEIQTYSIFAVTHKATGHYWFSSVQVGATQATQQAKCIIQSAIATYLDSMI